jgi:hypothetical protein
MVVWFIARSLLGAYLPIQASCGGGCVTGAGCEPVRLDLRIEAPSARAGKPSRVWFKASLTNSSCSEIQLPTDFLTLGRFTDSAQEENVGFFFETSVPRGAWRPALWKSATRLGDHDTAAVRPYWIDWESPSMFGSGKGLQHIWLAPAATATNLPSVYRPHKYSFLPGSEGHDFHPVRVSSSPRIAPEPPAGHRLLGEFSFPERGKYSVRLVFKDTVTYKPRYAYKQLPTPISVLLDVLALATGTLPEYYQELGIEVRSDAVHFEVR